MRKLGEDLGVKRALSDLKVPNINGVILLHKIFKIIAVLVVLTALHACTWVKPTPEGAEVVVSDSTGVVNCVSKGQVNASLKSRVGAFERKPGKVAGELETLARNEATSMGGDTVVAESDINEGQQTFGVYKCHP